MSIHIPPDYPFRAPHVRLLTKVFHPKITESGSCDFHILSRRECWSPALDIVKVLRAMLRLWGPAYSIVTVLRAMQKELEDTSADSLARVDIAALAKRDPAEFERQARKMTAEHSERIGPMTVREALSFPRAVRERHPLALSCDVQREMYLFEAHERSPEVQEFVNLL
jgi:ubiquitin-protein ligase